MSSCPHPPCPICQSAPAKVGEKVGKVMKRAFTLLHCPQCGFYFVENPWLEYEKIYDQDYYEGKGADPLVNYLLEIDEDRKAKTIRRYEYEGVLKLVRHCLPAEAASIRWLDYGCGPGGLVRFLRETTDIDASGFDQGWIAEKAKETGFHLLSDNELEKLEGEFDVITAIEVIEHCVDPLSVLAKIRRLLKPGGVFFFTTGNSQPFEKNILNWRYFTPEIHISLFQPKTMSLCLRKVGLTPEHKGFLPGLETIIRFKVLKNLGLFDVNPIEKLVPWNIAARLIDKFYKISEYPIGRG